MLQFNEADLLPDRSKMIFYLPKQRISLNEG